MQSIEWYTIAPRNVSHDKGTKTMQFLHSMLISHLISEIGTSVMEDINDFIFTYLYTYTTYSAQST